MKFDIRASSARSSAAVNGATAEDAVKHLQEFISRKFTVITIVDAVSGVEFDVEQFIRDGGPPN